MASARPTFEYAWYHVPTGKCGMRTITGDDVYSQTYHLRPSSYTRDIPIDRMFDNLLKSWLTPDWEHVRIMPVIWRVY